MSWRRFHSRMGGPFTLDAIVEETARRDEQRTCDCIAGWRPYPDGWKPCSRCGRGNTNEPPLTKAAIWRSREKT